MLSELARPHQVTLVTTHGPADDPAGLSRELAHCERVTSVPYTAAKRGSAAFAGALVRSWLSPLPVDLWKWRVAALRSEVAGIVRRKEADVIVADFLAGVPNVPLDAGVPVVFFAHNVEHQIWRRLADVETRAWMRRLLEVEWKKMRAEERRACEQTAMTVAVSADDRDRLAADAPNATVLDVPTGVDIRYFCPRDTPTVPGRLVFSGSMDWYPNEDAILYFIAENLPLVRRARPDVSLSVIGRQPSDRLKAAAAAAGVHVTGRVDDVRPHVAEGELYIVPLRVGGGTRLKIFEALAAGKPVLSTTIGAEGLDVENGRHLVLADGAEAFARETIALLNDAPRRQALGAEGRRIVEEKYSWAQVTKTFERYLEQALVRH
jgi:glycosyltransferase involved in cell wall biosynthesis